IRDPSPDFGRAGLNDYLTGFQAGGYNWQATLSAAVRLLPRTPSANGFLVSSISQPAASVQQLAVDIASASGSCGQAIDFQDAATISLSAAAALTSRFRYCDGRQPVYQLSLGESQPWRASVTDLGAAGRRSDLIGGSVIAYKLTRPAAQLLLSAQD